MGGHFERRVRTVKASLATAISRKLLTHEEFSTIVKEAKNIAKSRPLTYQSDNFFFLWMGTQNGHNVPFL